MSRKVGIWNGGVGGWGGGSDNGIWINLDIENKIAIAWLDGTGVLKDVSKYWEYRTWDWFELILSNCLPSTLRKWKELFKII